MELFIASILTFSATNIDDIFILMLFFGNKKYKVNEVIIGQFLGIIVLIAISVIGSLLGLLIDKSYIGLLGFLPMYLGIKSIIELLQRRDNEEKELSEPNNKKSNILNVAGVTIANGGDNIGIYIPVFAALTWDSRVVMIAIFILLTALWCGVAKYLSKHPLIAHVVDKYGHVFAPIILVLLGAYILIESETLSLISRLLAQ